MTAISTAIGLERKSRVAGYKIKKGFFENETPNLRMVVAILGEANTANQGTLSTDKKEVTSAQEAGELYGFGSPIHQMMRILRPVSGEGIGGIPTVVFPQEEAVGATATINEWTVTGAATENATHIVVINGRRSVDFSTYSYSVVKGDTATQVAAKIADAINSVLSSPVTAVAVGVVVTITTKWKGNTSAELKIRFDNNLKPAGISYSLTTETLGAGLADVSGALSQFGNEWYTIVVNPYGSEDTILTALEQFNGFPDEISPTGRYAGRIFMPFVSLFGNTDSDKDDLVLITDAAARVEQNTNVLCPAPNSEGFTSEAAANYCLLLARTSQDSPELDVNNRRLPDMPVPDNGLIGDMGDYDNRDLLVKKGCSTVVFENGYYTIQDLVTTYHPSGEQPLQYAYTRNLVLDWNVRSGYKILEDINVRDKVIVQDGQVTDSRNSVKPKQWKAVLYDYFDDLAVRALIENPEFSQESLTVEIDGTNPDRFNTSFRYKRTGIARIVSTDAEAGF